MSTKKCCKDFANFSLFLRQTIEQMLISDLKYMEHLVMRLYARFWDSNGQNCAYNSA